MTKVKYSYNPKTLRYERARFAWGTWTLRALGLLMVSTAFFYGLVLLHNHFFETEKEKILRAENEAFRRHHGIVQNDLQKAQIQLAALSEKDKAIYKRIFLYDKPDSGALQDETKELLHADLSDFKTIIDGLKEKSNKAQQKAMITSAHFAKVFWPGKEDVSDLLYYPTQIPVKNFTPSQLACGFGEHINPFHKLLYRHKGIDIAAEKGSEVVAAGSGRVVSIVNQSTPFGMGNYVEIEHAKGFRTRYAHLAEIKVSHGQKLKQGQVIGTVGMSGSAIAPHLHYEISKNNESVDPLYFFAEQLNERDWLGLIESNKKIKQALD
jgi:murein DD-endopeptidase MepM/ murein hydrolase activator NlpD